MPAGPPRCWVHSWRQFFGPRRVPNETDQSRRSGQAREHVHQFSPRIQKSKLANQAAELAEELIAIPLHATPIDMAFTGELAESVMCGGTKTPCGVIFASNATVLASLVNKRNFLLATRQSVRLALKD